MWFGQQGRYTNGGAMYDRSVYLDLYNCKNTFKRDTKNDINNKKRCKIVNPRFNLCLLGHPQYFIKFIKDEADNRCDGLMQRFLISCPEPTFFLYKSIKDAQIVPRKMSLTVLMFAIKIFHRQDDETNEMILRKYKFDDKAEKLYEQLHDEYKLISRDLSRPNVFISCMYSKAGIQLIRLSAILCAFENAFDLISSLDIANKKKKRKIP